MENKKLGGGILSVSIIYLVFLCIGLLGSIITFTNLDSVNSIATQAGIAQITPTDLIIGITLNLVSLAGIILILMKKKLGIYTFFTVVVINIIYQLVMSGFSGEVLLSILISLILPSLLAFFIYKKRELFGLGSDQDKLNL